MNFNVWYYRAIEMYTHLSVVYLFFFDFRERHFQPLRTYHETTTDNIRQHDVKYKNSKASFKCLDIHCH